MGSRFTRTILSAWIAAIACSRAADAALHVRHYHGWSITDGFIDFTSATKVYEGIDSNSIDYWDGNRFSLWQPVSDRNHQFGVEWTGYLRITEPGIYGIGTISDDGSEVWINDQRVVDNHEKQWYDWEDNVSQDNPPGAPPLNLGVGYHPITIRFFEELSYAGIELRWLKPSDGESNILPYSGTNFHDVPPTFNTATKWEIIPASAFVLVPSFNAADFNEDGVVDSVDLDQWKDDFGTSDGSDANNDSASDGADFLIWQREFGLTLPPSPVATVPEPTGGALIALLGILVVQQACTRCKSCNHVVS